jgi:putative MFS transporter
VTGLLGAAAFLGAALGLLIFGPVTDRLGRRTIFVVNLIIFVGFAVLSALITNVVELFLVRFFIGLAVGMDIPPSTAFLAEIAPPEQRGRFLGILPNVLWVLGFITADLVGLAFYGSGSTAWRWMFGLAAVPALVVLLGRQALPESPRWLVQRGDLEGAREAAMRLGIPMPPVTDVRQPTRYRDLFSRAYRRRTVVMAAVFGLNCLAGPITTLATPYILRMGGLLSVQSSILFSLAVYIVDLLGVFTGFMLIDRWPRRRLAYASVGGSGALAVVMGLIGFHAGPLLIVLYLLLAYTLWSGSATLVWVWGSELFPTRLRATGQGFTNAMCRLMIALNIYLVPVGIAALGVQNTIIAFALPLFAMVTLVATHPMFETRGRMLEDISG